PPPHLTSFPTRRSSDLQLSQESLRLGQLGKDRVVSFGQALRNSGGEFYNTFAVAGELIASFDLLFFGCVQFCRGYFIYLVTEQIEFLFARGLGRVEGGV